MNVPLSLYIHFPWCIRKCPYCDFNSHELQDDLPEERYVDALIADFRSALPYIQGRPIQTIFMGGGTPSLFSAKVLDRLLRNLRELSNFANNVEITLEANPGATEADRFLEYYRIGINRLSIGVQSFDDSKLRQLGRIHDAQQARLAIERLRAACYTNFNIDIMFGLPDQSLDEALSDLQQAIASGAPHISWYQLTLEPNTVFYSKPPSLPYSDDIYDIEQRGKELLSAHGYRQYEVSAYAKVNSACQHNMNYWTFGDYIGIGAGAHSKVTKLKEGDIYRYQNVRQPKDYLDPAKQTIAKHEKITTDNIHFEFMLNALRLQDKLPMPLYEERTGQPRQSLLPMLERAKAKHLLNWDNGSLSLTTLGHRYLNDTIQLFL